jgi:alpha-2-macroglobulin
LLANNTIVFKNSSATNLYVQVIQTYAPLQEDTMSKSIGLMVNVIYKNINGIVINPKSIAQGQDFYTYTIVTNTSTSRQLKNLALMCKTPTGWNIVSTASNNEIIGATNINIRDNIYFIYYDLAPKESKTFKVLLNASYKGIYNLPNIYTESMYDAAIFAKWGGGTTSVY